MTFAGGVEHGVYQGIFCFIYIHFSIILTHNENIQTCLQWWYQLMFRILISLFSRGLLIAASLFSVCTLHYSSTCSFRGVNPCCSNNFWRESLLVSFNPFECSDASVSPPLVNTYVIMGLGLNIRTAGERLTATRLVPCFSILLRLTLYLQSGSITCVFCFPYMLVMCIHQQQQSNFL